MFSFLSDLLRWFGQGLLTRPSSSTDGLSVPGRWRVTWRPRSAEGRLFVDHYLGGSLGPAVKGARRAWYPWTEQMSRKLSRKVRETRSSRSRKRPERGQEVLAGRRVVYPWTEQMSRKMSRNVEKRGVQAARNGPSPSPTPAGGPVAKPEVSMADRLGSRERAAGATHFVTPMSACIRSTSTRTEQAFGS